MCVFNEHVICLAECVCDIIKSMLTSEREMTPLKDVDVRERNCRPKGCCVGVVHRLALYALCISLRHHGNGALRHVSSRRLRPESFIRVLLPLDVPSPSSVSYSLWTSRILHPCLTPSVNTKSYGERSFFHVAPTLQRSSKEESRFSLYSFL